MGIAPYMALEGGADPHGIAAAHGFQNRCQSRLTSSSIFSSDNTSLCSLSLLLAQGIIINQYCRFIGAERVSRTLSVFSTQLPHCFSDLSAYFVQDYGYVTNDFKELRDAFVAVFSFFTKNCELPFVHYAVFSSYYRVFLCMISPASSPNTKNISLF